MKTLAMVLTLLMSQVASAADLRVFEGNFKRTAINCNNNDQEVFKRAKIPTTLNIESGANFVDLSSEGQLWTTIRDIQNGRTNINIDQEYRATPARFRLLSGGRVIKVDGNHDTIAYELLMRLEVSKDGRSLKMNWAQPVYLYFLPAVCEATFVRY